ncbi:MAG: DegT/DnrJ/EryC1/StrS family aminotransferase, partial [Spirochaetales bacterium]|nr:DegT/DnrJ/EryC1/StrS family aminotransferase [Spirochaetales bacterium]
FGSNCEAFQEEFAGWNGNRYGIFTNSGTAALHMCLVACGVGAGDHVLVTAYSWSSSATCILHHNAVPIFVDIDFSTMNMDLDKIEAAITPKTKAIVVVHLHGLAVDMKRVMEIAEKFHLGVIEDACQAHGALFDGRKVGTFGDCGAFSFNQNKCLCSGEGGMFVTNSEEKKDLAAQLWSFGETRTPLEDRDYHAYALGWMYRGSDMVAAFGRAQLGKLDSYLANQRENAAIMNRLLADLNGLIVPTEPEGFLHNWYNYTCRVDTDAIGGDGGNSGKRGEETARDKIKEALQAEGLPVGVWQSYPLPEMTVFKAKNAYGKGTPWSFDGAGDGVDYSMANFPIAKKHSQTHFGMTTPLRSPNGADVAEKTAEAISKVFSNLDQITFET